ncbi:uncharacterized protein LOC125636886 [Caretta caretta]|uniref:uncharacterized protein LOC125636886 n=1 Tax=Caretta caretta TaxID=8467 RepID=UPI003F4C3724
MGRDARGPPRLTPRKRRRRRLLGGRFAPGQAAEPASGPGGSEPGVASPAARRGGRCRGPPPTDQSRVRPGAAVAGAGPTPTPAPGGLGQPLQAAIPLPWLPPPRAACARQGGVVCSSLRRIERRGRLRMRQAGREAGPCVAPRPGGASETLPSNEPRTPRPLCPQPGAVPGAGSPPGRGRSAREGSRWFEAGRSTLRLRAPETGFPVGPPASGAAQGDGVCKPPPPHLKKRVFFYPRVAAPASQSAWKQRRAPGLTPRPPGQAPALSGLQKRPTLPAPATLVITLNSSALPSGDQSSHPPFTFSGDFESPLPVCSARCGVLSATLSEEACLPPPGNPRYGTMARCWTSSGFGGRKLSSPSCAPAVGIMISRDMMEKGHDQDTLQCRIKVKELWNAYCKACKANSCSSAAPLTCCFYKELDAILEGDPTSPPSTTMDASEPRSTRQEEEGDTLTSLAACSQELLSSQEEGSQLQRLVLGEGQTPHATLRSQLSVLSLAERLQRIKKRPRRSKEDMLPEVMQQSLNEKSKSTGVAGEGKEGPPAECGSLAPKHGAAAKHYGARSGRDTGACSHAGRALPCSPPPAVLVPKLSLVPPCHLQPTLPHIWFLLPPAASNTYSFTTQTYNPCPLHSTPPSPCILVTW